jgi:serine/threonine-protein kinase
MAEDPTDVMRKHLREELVPPDHINTSLSAGVSEIIEVMMAKRKEDRYKSVEELLTDLEAVKDGRPPLRARKRFDVSILEQLEEGGDTVQTEEEPDNDETVKNYRLAIIALGALAAILFLAVVFLLVFRR